MYRHLFRLGGTLPVACVAVLISAATGLAQYTTERAVSPNAPLSGQPPYFASPTAGDSVSSYGFVADPPTWMTSINYPGLYGAFFYGPGGGFYTAGHSQPAVVAKAAAATSAAVTVRLPARAALWFNDVRTDQSGTVRQFVSPPLRLGRAYHYDIEARWTEDDRTITRTRTVTVAAGDRLHVDLRFEPRPSTMRSRGESRRESSMRSTRPSSGSRWQPPARSGVSAGESGRER